MIMAANKNRQSDSQYFAPFALLAVAQTLAQKPLHTACVCGWR